jgi:hypothetical protein
MYHEWRRRGMRIGYWWKSQRKEAAGRPRRRWVDNIGLAQERNRWRALVNSVLNLRVP